MKTLRISILLACAGSTWAQVGSYSGPSILNRGGGPVGRSGGRPLEFRLFANVSEFYESGLTPAATDAQGQVPDFDGWGTAVGVGAYGYHAGKRSIIGLDYRGNYRHYPKRTYYNGTDHFLNLGYTRQVSRRLELSLQQGAGIYSTVFGGLGFGVAGDPLEPIADPGSDIFDARTYAYVSTARAVYQKSARLLFGATGTGFIVRRHSTALVGANGYGASGDVTYLLGRRQSIGAMYQYFRYDYTRRFGTSGIHSVALNYTRQLSRLWRFQVRAGAYRVESSRLVTVRLDPLIAALLGQRTSVEVFHGLNYGTILGANLTGNFRRSMVDFYYDRGLRPGNGFYLTSQSDSVGVRYSYTGLRRWNFGFDANYLNYKSVTVAIGNYRTVNGRAGVTYRINSFLHLTSRVELRRAEVAHTQYLRDRYRIVLGFSVSSGDTPLSLW